MHLSSSYELEYFLLFLKKKNMNINAALGPTNTGKTYYAIERMTSYQSGIIGLPLRLLTKEVFDKISNIVGPSRTAMITGEERIIPQNPKYWVCTVESMPIDKYLDFYKIGSGDLTCYPLIEKLAKKGKPIILSTGLSSLKEVNQTIKFIKSKNSKYKLKKNLSILQCTSTYPTLDEEANLNVIKNLLIVLQS